MIKIVNIGMNHESAPVELRECLARDEENANRALRSMRESQWIHEGLFLSTCNRIEALYTTESHVEAQNWMISLFSQLSHLPEEQFISNLYIYENSEAIRHIFRVASSLDSMIMGEPQILGQIKEAYYRAVTKEKTSGVILNRLMHRAFHVAKRIRTETRIAEAAVSISYAAVELAKKIFYHLSNKKVLLVGAGEMAELAAQHLLNNGVESLTVANRNFEKALQIAETFHGKAVFLEEIEPLLLEVDIIISSTASTEYVIHYDQVKQCLKKRRNRPLFFIDIAVPRDIDPLINELGNVYLYDIDDLRGVIEINTILRRNEAIKAERIITEEVMRFNRWLETLDIVPTIISLKEKVEAIRKNEIKKSLSGLGDLTPTQEKALESLTISLVEKIIHDPIIVLKDKASRSSKDSYLDFVKKLFKLDDALDERILNGS